MDLGPPSRYYPTKRVDFLLIVSTRSIDIRPWMGDQIMSGLVITFIPCISCQFPVLPSPQLHNGCRCPGNLLALNCGSESSSRRPHPTDTGYRC